MIPIENKGKSPLYVAGFVILPGETRLLAARDVPPHLRSAPADVAAAPVADAMTELAGKKVSEIGDSVPALSDDELDRLASIERAKDKPRAGVTEAITKEMLRRADSREKLQEFDAAVAKMDDDALRAYRENVAQHPELVLAIDAELQKRAGG